MSFVFVAKTYKAGFLTSRAVLGVGRKKMWGVAAQHSFFFFFPRKKKNRKGPWRRVHTGGWIKKIWMW
jgi:hypothetical protein